MNQSTLGERITAAISTVVAIALLGAALSAQQAQAPPADQLASLEADLRLQLEFAFGQNRAAYRQHVAVLDDALAAWRESSQSPGDYELLVDWLRAAIGQTMPGHAGDLPARPEFSEIPPPATIDSAESLVEPTPTPADEPPAEDQPATEQETPLAVDSAAAPPVVFEEPIAAPAPAPHPDAPVADSVTPEPPADAPPTAAVAEPSVEHSITVEPAVVAPPLANETADAAPTPEVTPELTPELTPEPPQATPPSDDSADSPPPVTINLAELNARIAGYHQGLAEVEAAIVAERAPSAEQLGRLVSQLEQLAGQYQFVRLYFDALTPQEQRRAAEPRPMSDTVDLVAAQVAAAGDRDLLQDFDAARADQPTLAERLQAIAAALGNFDAAP